MLNRVEIRDSEELYRDLCLVLDENDFSDLVRRRLKKKLWVRHKRGRLVLRDLDDNWVWRLCCAGLMRGRYDWYGWEKRSSWAWRCATEDWFYPRWDGRDCRLLVLGEQGIGDEILFSSCVPDLLKSCSDVVIECDDRLHKVFGRSFGVDCISRWDGEIGKALPMDRSRGEFDAFIPMGELPKLYRRSRQDFPGDSFLKVCSDKREKWLDYLSDPMFRGPHIGISWYGGDGKHVIDPSELMLGGSDFIDLQYNFETEGCRKLEVEDYDDEMALVSCLDHVNTVPTAILHVCGALGVSCNVIRPDAIHGDFNNRLRWEFGLWDGRMDWYSSVRTYRSLREWRDANK